ncbi:AAA family ATPase [Pseudomonas sp. SLFW]|uniref:AAA family ATPase n=1 Tax=Pseudomonas sp. SLFW TaxID=2683259 RepID=UPI001412F3AB|nr:AAA family ATPase [Pseudomonas sp. SLFW]NBB11067.1 AAA family ATPase [Pseudomonas sp. SLFW]
MHIQKLQIENLRSFKAAEIEFNLPETKGVQFPNVNVLLGDNGLGKTSVLRAVALATLGPLLSGSSGFVSEGLVRRPPASKAGKVNLDRPEPAELTATVRSTESELSNAGDWPMPSHFSMTTHIRTLSSTEKLDWSVSPNSTAESAENLQFDEASPAFFVVGYGATRRVEASSQVDGSARMKSRLRRYERVAGLFEEHMSLMPLSYWLPAFAEQNKGRYKQVITLINKLLPDHCQIQPAASRTRDGLEHLFEMNGIALPFRALSDGFRGYIGWIGDMLFHICQGVRSGERLNQTRGVVMVDEIDLHLHPEWQRTVVPTLAAALPNIQFILTTHSPLVVGSLSSNNLYVLEYDQEEAASVIKRLPEIVQGKNSDQILLSPYFGLDTTRSAMAAETLSELARRAEAGDPDAALNYLKVMSRGIAAQRGDTRSASKTSGLPAAAINRALKKATESKE